MEEQIERPGIFARIKGMLLPGADDEEDEITQYEPGSRPRPALRVHPSHPYHVSVRKEVLNLEDARLAGDGLKEGTQQIINLAQTKPELRERIIDFLGGVVYALEGSVEKIGDNIFLFAPRQAVVDLQPSTNRFRRDD